jgi:hypothetical protein
VDDWIKDTILERLLAEDDWVGRYEIRKFIGYHNISTLEFYALMKQLEHGDRLVQSRKIDRFVQYRHIDATRSSCPLCGRTNDPPSTGKVPEWFDQAIEEMQDNGE